MAVRGRVNGQLVQERTHTFFPVILPHRDEQVIVRPTSQVTGDMQGGGGKQ